MPLPIELGAEFIHGEAQETFGIVEAAGLLVYELPDTYWWSSGARWRLIDDFWGEMTRLRRRIPVQTPDISFADFLKTQRKLPPRLKQLATGFVEGYYASHADRISAASLRASEDEEKESRQFRIANGYDALVAWLRAGLDPERSSLRLSSEVTMVRWKRGQVEIRTKRGEAFRAAAAIITTPIGVWKSPAAIIFEPDLPEKQKAIDKLEVGHVVKIVFRFRERFWDAPEFLKRRAPKQWQKGMPLHFVNAADGFVPTWWTAAPVRAPLLTAWAGGHAADDLLAKGNAAIPDRALDSLASTFNVKRRELNALLDSVHFHDWQADPFSRGAYSYPAVGGVKAHAALAKPIAGTLFFAGEATTGEETGTVAGAITTGRRAAKKLLAALA